MNRYDQVFFINIMPSNDKNDDENYITLVKNYVKKTKKNMFAYTLITLGNKRIEPWTLGQAMMNENQDFNPLIAVNPYLQHPIEIVKKIASLQLFYKNSIALNLIPGSFKQEMKSLSDQLDFEKKQVRLEEFHNVLQQFFKNKNKCTYDGQFYQLQDAKIYPELHDEKIGIFLSGMSDKTLDGYYVNNIKPMDLMKKSIEKNSGLILGVCTRKTKAEAQEAMNKLYPEDRSGQMLFEMNLASDETSLSVLIKDLLKDDYNDAPDFNLRPMKCFKSKVPFIVGSYEEVAEMLKKYYNLGYGFFILDFHPEDFDHIQECMKIFKN